MKAVFLKILNKGDVEMSYDEKVLSQTDGFTADYGASLLTFAANRRFLPSSPIAFSKSGISRRVNNILRFQKPRRCITALALLLCIAVTTACAVNPVQQREKETLYGNYTFVRQIYMNPLSSFIAPDGYKIYYTLGEDELLITDENGNRRQEAADYDKKPIDKQAFPDAFSPDGVGAPDISQYRECYQLLTCDMTDSYRLYKMDDEYWLAVMKKKADAKGLGDSDYYVWSVYEIARYDGDLPAISSSESTYSEPTTVTVTEKTDSVKTSTEKAASNSVETEAATKKANCATTAKAVTTTKPTSVPNGANPSGADSDADDKMTSTRITGYIGRLHLVNGYDDHDDTYMYKASVTGRYCFKLLINEMPYYKINIYDNNHQIAYGNSADMENVLADLSAGKTYKIKVSPYTSFENSHDIGQKYDIKIYIPNSPKTVKDGAVYGKLEYEYQQDMCYFTPEETGEYHIRVTVSDRSRGITVFILDGSDVIRDTNMEDFDIQLTGKKTYVIKLTNNGNGGSYTYNVTINRI